jgi:hypothetical protein
MKRLYTVLSLVLLIAVLAMPAIARADDIPPPAEQSQPAEPAPDGWTWDDTSAPPGPDGWTWDEASAIARPAADGWTWDEG